MNENKEQLSSRLVAAVQDLPGDKIAEVLDFVGYLRHKYGRRGPKRGSAESVLHALEEVGPLEFETDELESLLADIDQMRELDHQQRG